MIAPILVATHDAPHADRVLERAAGLAVAVGAELHAVCVVAPMEINAAVGDAGAVVIAGMEHEMEAHSKTALDRARAVGERHGLDVVAHLEHGEPAATIVNVADDIGADMIVLGSTGLDAAGRYVLGSVPERVLFDAHGHDLHVVRTTT
ncbi:MAG: universal stress protein [Ilumatobacteraceae bacterium]